MAPAPIPPKGMLILKPLKAYFTLHFTSEATALSFVFIHCIRNHYVKCRSSMTSGNWRISRGRSSSVDRSGDLGLGHVGSRVINTLSIEKGEDKMLKSMHVF